ncbi:MAG: SDR family NAD(P)-dependent oxidoreductase [Microcystis sp. LE19-4.1E]|nr:SDR family NAD(P)-dependent oxidoreductase [Microcystis sp. LE19-4.1E]
MAGRLDGKIAVITGGGGGIGSAAGELFAREGAKVALIDVTQEIADAAADRIRASVKGAHVEGFAGDLGVEAEAGRLVSEIVQALGGLDVLINNVGIRRYDAVADASWDKWEDIMRVNVLSYSSMVRAALPALRKSGRGSIVNVASTGAIFGRKGMAAYDASKAALLAYTRTIAHEENEHGIRANTICPGYTRTTFHLKRLGEDVVDGIVPPCVMQRWAEPKEMAYPLLWLASDEASYITGANLMVDGGYIGP